MNRRQFIIVGAGAGLVPSLLLIEGCGKVTAATLADLAQTLGSAAASLETILGNSAAAKAISDATTTVVADLQNWVPGTTDQAIIEAIGLLEALINDIPVTPEIQELVDLALVTIQGILSLLPSSQSSVTAAVTLTAAKKAKTPLRTPSAQSVGLSRPPYTTKDFVKSWNNILSPIAAKNAKWSAAHI